MTDPQELRVYRFKPDALDPITVFVEQYRPGSSRMTVQCYAQAWSAYWGSHGHNPLEEFVCDCHAEYIADGLKWGTNGLILRRREKDNYAYLVRIVEAIQSHFRQSMKEAA
jgi:hypothetical protein